MRAFIFLISLLIMSCSMGSSGLEKVTLESPNGKEIVVEVEIADEQDEQREGLMHRKELKEGHGMLFIFGETRRRSFWMKETLIPLDIIYFDENGEFVSYKEMRPCLEDPCKTYSSEYPAKYALEVNAGFAEKNGIGDGWKLSLK